MPGDNLSGENINTDIRVGRNVGGVRLAHALIQGLHGRLTLQLAGVLSVFETSLELGIFEQNNLCLLLLDLELKQLILRDGRFVGSGCGGNDGLELSLPSGDG